MSTVNSPAAAAAAAAEGLRAEAREILQLEADGGPIRDVLTRVQLFANNNSRSALACNLKGRMYKKLGDRIFPSSALSAKMYYETAEDAFDRAAQLAPACVTTAVAHANALAACSRYADAEKEFRRAVSVRRSVDPSFHNLISSDVPALTSSEDRKGEALLKARQDRLAFLGEVNKMIHQSAKELIGREFSHKAREEADALASKFPFSLRAQMLRIFLEREFARNLPQNINQEKFLERVFQKTTKLIDDFERSCILALFRAELLVDMKKYKEAREECQRGLMIAQPSNPCDEVLPPRNAEICVSDVRMQLSNLVDAISEQAAETEVSSLDSDSENVPLIKAEKSKDVQCKLQQMVIEKGIFKT